MARRGCNTAVLGLFALVALAALQGVRSQMHTQLETLSDACKAQLDNLWLLYDSPPVSPVAGCDKACIQACHATLEEAIASEKLQHCPAQEEIIKCMHVYRAQWLTYVDNCALFQYGLEASAEGEGEGESGSGSSSSSSEAEAEASTDAEAEASTDAEAEASTDAEAEASTDAEAEAEAEATPSPPPAEAEAEAEAATAAGRRRTLLQEAEAEGGGGVYNGCFPLFANAQEFEMYLNGELQPSTSSSAVGFTLSALYFASLLLLGIGLPAWAKPWKKIKWGKLFKCGKFGKSKAEPTVLPAPAQQAMASEPPAEATR